MVINKTWLYNSIYMPDLLPGNNEPCSIIQYCFFYNSLGRCIGIFVGTKSLLVLINFIT